MAVTLPKILVTFTQLATSFIQRSARGIAVLIVRDDTAGTGKTFFQYGDATQVSDTEFTPANQQYIKDALSFGPLRVSVVKIKTADDLAAAAAIFTQYEKTGWVTFAEGSSDDWSDLSSWIKAQETAYKSWKAVCFKAAAPDSMHIVNLSNEKVTFADTRGEASGEKYCASLAGLLASCNVEQGATNKLCPNLTRVAVPEEPDTVVGAGKFLLINDDDEVRVGVDVNALTTTNGTTLTEDMKYIETVEAMDMLRDDITATFRDEYLGKYRNSKANQMLFISAVNYYFDTLAAAPSNTRLDPGPVQQLRAEPGPRQQGRHRRDRPAERLDRVREGGGRGLGRRHRDGDAVQADGLSGGRRADPGLHGRPGVCRHPDVRRTYEQEDRESAARVLQRGVYQRRPG